MELDNDDIEWDPTGPVKWFGMELPSGEYVPFDNATIGGGPMLTITWASSGILSVTTEAN